jgi:hypothetical protein
MLGRRHDGVKLKARHMVQRFRPFLVLFSVPMLTHCRMTRMEAGMTLRQWARASVVAASAVIPGAGTAGTTPTAIGGD